MELIQRSDSSLAPPVSELTSAAAISDVEIVGRVRSGETALYGLLVRRHQRRLYALAHRILRNDAEAEDVMQEAHVRAFSHLGQFEGRSSIFAWLAKILVHEALARLRRRSRFRQLEPGPVSPGIVLRSTLPDPERQASDRELESLLRPVLLSLPDPYRTVFTLRAIEERSTSEAAHRLGVTCECIKTRLHRARAMLRRKIGARLGRSANPRTISYSRRTACRQLPNARWDFPR